MRAIFENVTHALDSFEKTANQAGILQSIHPCVKIISLTIFAVTVLSFNKYTLISLVPYFFMLSLLTAGSYISFKSIFFKILAVSPFVLFIAIFNPIIDRNIMTIFGVDVVAGYVSFLSIIMKFILTVWAGFLFISTTSFLYVVAGLKKLYVPEVLANQFYFLYRYIGLLIEETVNIFTARSARLGNAKFSASIFATVAGQLLIKTLKRSDKIYNSMLARGFDGEFNRGESLRAISQKDIFFLFLVLFCTITLRLI